MKTQTDGHRRDVQFAMGEHVYLKLRPYYQHSVAHTRNEKLSPRYFGPYVIEERIREVAYRLRLPPSSAIHPMFYVSQLRQAIGDHSPSQELPPTLTEEMEVTMEPESVKGIRYGTTGKKEVLICWKGLADHDSTWEEV